MFLVVVRVFIMIKNYRMIIINGTVYMEYYNI
jgi:hypothetical protein